MATPAEIEALLSQPEGIDLEFKYARVEPRALGRIIAAFANTRGGTIIVGIDQRKPLDQGGLTGVNPDIFQRIVDHARRRLSPQPEVQAFCVEVKGKELGVIRVEASPQTPIFNDGQVAIRIGAGITTAPFSGVVVGAPDRAVSVQSAPEIAGEQSGRVTAARRRRLIAIGIAAVVLPGALLLVRFCQGENLSSLVPVALVICFSILFSGVGMEVTGAWSVAEDVSRTRERVRQAEADLEEGLRSRHADIMEAEDEEQARLTLSDLWTVTHRRLDHYHGIALEQAAKSFRNAQAAMAVGFILLVGFALVGLFANTTAGAIVAGALGTVSAALAGYVSRTFVKSQETAAGHLRAYFDQPLEFSRYLAAERLIADARLEAEQRAQILGSLVQTMIAGPASRDSQDIPKAE